MRMIKPCIAFVLATLVGCSTYQVDHSLPSNVHTKSISGHEYVDKIDFALPTGPQASNNLNKCIAIHVDNDEVTLKDRSGSHFGAFTGTYYRNAKQRELAGGQVLQHGDDGVAVANGRLISLYSGGLVPIQRVIDYKLIVETGENRTNFTFTNLQTAHLDTGAADNNGLAPLGAWSGAKPMIVKSDLESLANEIAACL